MMRSEIFVNGKMLGIAVTTNGGWWSTLSTLSRWEVQQLLLFTNSSDNSRAMAIKGMQRCHSRARDYCVKYGNHNVKED